MNRPRLLITLAAVTILLVGCSAREPAAGQLPVGAGFTDYWYSYGAEISRYRLEQARYGAMHAGDAVLIYVTEPFDPIAQVKYEGASPEADGAVQVLKLNATKSFLTGVYPYSLMTSVFTPIPPRQVDPAAAAPREAADPLKITATSQEWCGQTFTQLNRREAGWQVRVASYFQAEGDQELQLGDVLAEAGVWVQIRLDPKALPVGTLSMLPDPQFIHLAHVPSRPYTVTATRGPSPERVASGAVLEQYRLTYPELNRELTIHFQRDFPHLIEKWQETYPSRGRPLQTTATRTHSTMLDYWSRNQPADRPLRQQLGLPGSE